MVILTHTFYQKITSKFKEGEMKAKYQIIGNDSIMKLHWIKVKP